MRRRWFLLGGVSLPALVGQQIPPDSPAASAVEAPVEFVCPMDPGVRSPRPGRCPRCGMALVAGIPDALEYPVSLRLNPAVPRAGQPVDLAFTVSHPKTGARITEFQLIHEKLFHLFAVSQDLSFFLHDHPRLTRGGVFRFRATFPKPGMYRMLSDFYPSHGTPQLVTSTVIVPGGPITPGTTLKPDLSPKRAANLEVSLTMEPARPIAGMKTLLFFHLNPADGLEPYLGAWGHMLAASEDLTDLIHTHPFLADGGPVVQFNLIFPRPVTYRVWVQFQRKGVVNTSYFDISAGELK